MKVKYIYIHSPYFASLLKANGHHTTKQKTSSKGGSVWWWIEIEMAITDTLKQKVSVIFNNINNRS
jgi:hypothetical protein